MIFADKHNSWRYPMLNSDLSSRLPVSAFEVSDFVWFHLGLMRSLAIVKGLLYPAPGVMVLLISPLTTPQVCFPIVPEYCSKADPKDVKAGLLLFRAIHQEFGTGWIVDEGMIDDLLHVVIQNDQNEDSAPLPITEVLFL